MLYNKTHINHEPESVAESVARLIVSKSKTERRHIGALQVAHFGRKHPEYTFRIAG